MSPGMRFAGLSRFLVLLPLVAGKLSADPEELPVQPQVSLTAGASGTWNADWAGLGHRVYFLKWTLDMETWHFAPFMEFDAGIKSRGMASTSGKFFVRLDYYDDPGIENLEQAMNADFDGDGVSNINEVTILDTNPLLFSTNGNVLGDGAQDWDSDGISNADEVALGLDPGVDNTGIPSGAATVTHAYDDTGRLTGSTTPVSSATYTLDAEGNIEGN